MGVFSKLFRRGGGGGGKNNKPPQQQHQQVDLKSSGSGSKGSMVGRLRVRRINASSSSPTDRDSPTELMNDPNQPHVNGAAAAEGSAAAQRRAGPDFSAGSQRVRSSRADELNGHGATNSNMATTPLSSVGNSINLNTSSSSSNPSSPSSKWRSQRSPNSPSAGPVDLDASDVEDSTTGSSRDDHPSLGRGSKHQARLSSQRLEEFEKQHPNQSHRGVPVFTMEDAGHIRFSAGQLTQHDTNSEDESSFNLSTDAEDTDYENLKRRGVLPPMDTSTYSGQYNTDGESTSVFPNLPTDDEGMSMTTNDRDDLPSKRAALGGSGAGVSDILSLSKASNDSSIDAMAWAKDKDGGFDSSSTPAGGFRASTAFNIATVSTTANGTSATSVTRRSFTSPKKAAPSSASPTTSIAPTPQASASSGAIPPQFDDFANFADFANVTFPSDPAWDPTTPSVPTAASVSASHIAQARSVFETKPQPQNHNVSSPSVARKTPSAAVYTDTSLSELLAQAKSKSSRQRSTRPGGGGSNSINSAPALSASYLRQHHGLKPRAGASNRADPSALTPGGGGGGGSSRIDTGAGGTSVTDIIHSLEAANASRMSNGGVVKPSGGTALNTSLNSGSRQHPRPPSRSGGDLDATSVHSRDNASVRSAKERIRRRREQRQNRQAGSDSSDSDDNNGSESWLIDEVTGALGPRGIAPDLESLSGRSNRSRSSGGGRSHKSHRSHRSSGNNNRVSSSSGGAHRRPKSSSGGDSVSSHGSRRSRGSRHSRSSRYSHRSTRSYLSQMSEQSRSVANDLLRLEMQLAMVGNGGSTNIVTEDGGGTASASQRTAHPSAVSRHHTSSSRSSRGSSRRAGAGAAARRTRMTIIAPPGKLGIILANRADSRGTVVSGVRTSSVMAEQISPGDRIVAIDGEDVSLMTVSEITTIMTRNVEFERTLTVLTTPRHAPSLNSGEPPMSPRSSSDYDYLHGK